MNTRKTTLRHWGPFALTPLALAMAWAGAAHGADIWLCAKSTSVTMPGGVSVPMWGYALDTLGFAGNCAAPASVPGPALTVAAGEGLTVHLRNVDLPEPTSLVIPGQVTTMAPVRHTAGQYAGRVRSFAAEATVGGIDPTYTWADLKPGTYLYHSGTHPQVQVQMGLYGAVEHDAATGQVYAGVPYASDVTLLFSEIDPDLHAAVAAGQYGPNLPVSSTIDYAPQYFLINGQPYTDPSPPLPAGAAGQTTLLRLLNAGLQSRSPVLQGMHMRLVAEDGNPYPHVREQYSVFLPALKTVDAVITPASAATYPIYDRRLGVTNPGPTGSVDGGMLAFLAVAGAPGGTPLADNDAYATNEDVQLIVAAPGVLDGDDPGTTASLLSGPSHGTLSLLADGSFTYTPQANYNGADSFSYRAVTVVGGVPSLPATVSLTVNPVNDAPVAAGDAYSVAAGTILNAAAPGVLGNDSDMDGDGLTAVPVSGPASGSLVLNADGSFSYTPNAGFTGTDSFTYQASDGVDSSAAATVTITVLANRPPVATDDTVNTPRNTPLTINVLANDSDPDGNLLPATVTIVTPPNKGGTATVNADGTVSYTPKLNFRGTENFTYQVSDSLGATLYTSTKSTTDSRAIVKVNVK
jgi:FtsP/CotA-like multicopper oxidase with cupredoxin domain